MTRLDEMKDYLRNNNLTHLVREIVSGTDCTSEDAIELVYDQHVLTKEQFIAKYFG